ncbi:hypothetical protein AVEN_201198-1, partial [Araneus ventricosus]
GTGLSDFAMEIEPNEERKGQFITGNENAALFTAKLLKNCISDRQHLN